MYSIFDLGCSLLDAKLDTGSLQMKNNSIFFINYKMGEFERSGSGLNILTVKI